MTFCLLKLQLWSVKLQLDLQNILLALRSYLCVLASIFSLNVGMDNSVSKLIALCLCTALLSPHQHNGQTWAKSVCTGESPLCISVINVVSVDISKNKPRSLVVANCET